MKDLIMDCLSVNTNGNLQMGGCDVAEVARKYGTPLYIIDEDTVRKNCKMYVNAMDKYYGGNGLVLFASKALSCKYICKIMKEEGMGVDVSSGGELYTALSAGFDADKIYFHGNNKSIEEIKLGIDENIGRFVVDNKQELDTINKEAGIAGKKIAVSFRIKPGVEAHTHEFIRTGQIDSKFGTALETGEAEELIGYAAGLENIDVAGIHCHIGSQIFDLAPFEVAAEKMLNFLADINDKYSLAIHELNLGGGFGVKYTNEDSPIEYDKYIEAVSKVVRRTASERNIELPFIVLEPGRSIVAPAGLTTYTVGCVKEIPNVRTYAVVDGGMADNPRYIMYGAKYTALLTENPVGAPAEVVTIAGKCCESGDVLIKDIALPKIESGDLISVLTTGAYNYSMASNYNRLPRPPIVAVSKGKDTLIVKRETYEDLIRNDIL